MASPTTTFRPLLVIIGPSASGKTSIAAELERTGTIRLHSTWTTRPRRADETGAVAGHRFTTDASFDAIVAAGLFLDVVQPFGLPARYGLPKIDRSPRGPIDAVLLRAPFVERLRTHVPDLFVVQVEASALVIDSRLAQRGLSAAEIAARRSNDARELELGRHLADANVVNDSTLEAAATTIRSALGRHDDARTAA